MHGWFNVAQQDFSFRSELDSLGASDKKNLIQFAFQCFDGLADSRLGDEKQLGCLRKT